MPTKRGRSSAAGEPVPEKEWGFKEWFFAGALLGVIYGLFRYPQVLGCLFLVVLVFGVILVYFYWTYIAVVLVAGTVAWLFWRSRGGTS